MKQIGMLGMNKHLICFRKDPLQCSRIFIRLAEKCSTGKILLVKLKQTWILSCRPRYRRFNNGTLWDIFTNRFSANNKANVYLWSMFNRKSFSSWTILTKFQLFKHERRSTNFYLPSTAQMEFLVLHWIIKHFIIPVGVKRRWLYN